MGQSVTAYTWEGFQPIGYEIDWEKFSTAPLRMCGDDRSDTVDTTVRAVLTELFPHRYGDPPRSAPTVRWEVKASELGVEFRGDDRSIKLDTLNKTSDAAHFLATVVKLLQESEAHGDAWWRPTFYYFDRDRLAGDPVEIFRFFAVNADRIVLDHVSLSRRRDLGESFNGGFLKPALSAEDAVCAKDRHIWAARLRQWYRRFYEETHAGQLAALRDDIVPFYYLPEWRYRAEMLTTTRTLSERLMSIRRWLIGGLVGLGVLALVLLLRA